LGGQSESDNIAAVEAVGEVLRQEGALGFRQRLLGECGEKIRVGMRLRGGLSQTLEHDFGHVLHF
jgi:hypothetical protein